MKFTLLQSNFAKALSQTTRIVGVRATLPVLSNILIQANKNKVVFSATDLEVGITTSAVGKIEAEGAITLPARLLSDFVMNNKDESIGVSLEGTIATLKSAHYEVTIMGIAAEEFPTVPSPARENTIAIKKDLFLESLKKVNIAPATDETRPVLAGILIKFEGKTLTMAATDSYRLAEKILNLPEESKDHKIIVPSRTMNELLRIVSGDAGPEVVISSSDNQVSFEIGDTVVVSRLIEGSFPAYSQIIPVSSKTKAEVASADLLASVKMSLLFAKDAANNSIKIAVGKDNLTVVSQSSQAGSSKSVVEAAVTGDPVEVSFNARYIVDVLNVLSSDKVVLELNDSISAGVFKALDDPDYLYLIMPLKIES